MLSQTRDDLARLSFAISRVVTTRNDSRLFEGNSTIFLWTRLWSEIDCAIVQIDGIDRIRLPPRDTTT